MEKPLVNDDEANISHGDLNPAPQVEKGDVKYPTVSEEEAQVDYNDPSAATEKFESNVTVPENSVAPFVVKPVESHDLQGRAMGVVGSRES